MSESRLSYHIKDGKVYVQFFDAWWEVMMTTGGNCFIPTQSRPVHKFIKKKRDIKKFD
jgi:hypothetical protein